MAKNGSMTEKGMLADLKVLRLQVRSAGLGLRFNRAVLGGVEFKSAPSRT